ncbi:N-acetylglucosamine-6-phosphate deacetylase [Marmoricola endophyticus]|uniref:N-acetylglucosamine-6-phosphate deacetylase n=1 Tax=Marmoricola endophyticus TaxID=2040280 RepID=A0A917BDI9_9ACTN|nr:N-acetylglucosamine-6-phosphate deacetylase [Marmoricola endophyticus]GGF38805.1 N-acetylglucosamine-6-phosphate deacetylase [Marmoricola endophyticus]
MILAARRLVTPARDLAPGWLAFEDGLVADLGEGPPPRPADLSLDGTVTPGFVDTHVHGGGGRAFDEGAEAAEAVVAAHLATGTTTVVASLVTLPDPERAVKELSPLVDDGLLAGLHLEGPWLSPEHRGAHDPALLETPTPDRVESFLALADGRLRMVTLAPELDGGLDAVRRLTAAGVVVAVGHTDATYDVTRAALDAGAGVGTHLFNAMRPVHHREPGPVTALLEHPDAVVELIADGLHLHPAVLRLAASAKPQHTTLVTDAMAAAAARDGDYRLGDLPVSVRDGEARLADGTIAGSTLTMARAVRYAVTTAGLSLPDAVRAATLTPARTLGLDRVGDLRPGWAADLVVLDDDLAVRRVMKAGRWV